MEPDSFRVLQSPLLTNGLIHNKLQVAHTTVAGLWSGHTSRECSILSWAGKKNNDGRIQLIFKKQNSAIEKYDHGLGSSWFGLVFSFFG